MFHLINWGIDKYVASLGLGGGGGGDGERNDYSPSATPKLVIFGEAPYPEE